MTKVDNPSTAYSGPPPLAQGRLLSGWDCRVRFAYFANAKCTGRNDIVDWDCHSLTASQWHYYLRLPQSLYSLCKCKTYATQWKNNPSVRLSSDTSLCTKEAAKGDEIPTDINVLCCRKMYTAEWQDTRDCHSIASTIFANAKRTQHNDATTIVYDTPHDVKVMTLDLCDYCASMSCRQELSNVWAASPMR